MTQNTARLATPCRSLWRRFVLAIAALSTIALVAACGGFDASSSIGGPGGGISPGGGGVGGNVGGGSVGGGGNLGATPGGAQDFRFVREQIRQGQVPRAEHYVTEGLLSEHDLPLGGSCNELLCVRLAAGVSPVDQPIADATTFDLASYNRRDSDKRLTYVQVGFSSGLRADSFRREPLNLALVVDVSGSMGVSKMNAAKRALEALAGKLDERDVVSIVKFNNSAATVLPPTRGDATATIKAAIARLYSGGGTSIEAGMIRGLQQIEAATQAFEGQRSKRLMLFTDAMPNVGATSPNSFRALVQSAAKDSIGLTAFGVGIDFNSTLVNFISNERGGNYFYLANADAIATVFDKDFDYMVTPLAYDLELKLTLAKGFRVAKVYGVPAFKQGEDSNTIKVPTVFLSRKKGAIVIVLERDENALSGSTARCLTASLRYERTDGSTITGNAHAQVPTSALQAGAAAHHDQLSVRKAVALVHFVEGMRRASAAYHAGDSLLARVEIERTMLQLAADAASIGKSLEPEVDLAKQLAALLGAAVQP